MEVSCGIGSGLQPNSKVGGTFERGCQQGAPLRAVDGVRRSDFRSTNALHPRKVLTHDEGFIEGDPEGRTPG